MYIDQKELLWELDKGFVKKFVGISKKKSHKKGELLFRAGDPADSLFVLTKGRVRLMVGESGHTVYTVNHSGEIFGWSSIVGRDVYTATAECVEPTTVQKIDREALHEILQADKANGMIFFKKIAEALGNRLLNSYTHIPSAATVGGPVLQGTGQLQEVVEPE